MTPLCGSRRNPLQKKPVVAARAAISHPIPSSPNCESFKIISSIVKAVKVFASLVIRAWLLHLEVDGQSQRAVELAQQALSLLGKSRNAGNDGTSQVDNGSLNQVQNDTDGATEERVHNETVGANERVDEDSVGIDELLQEC